jgi:hypothetical protein
VRADGARYEKIKLSPTKEEGDLLAGNMQLSSGNIIFALKIRKLVLPSRSCCDRETGPKYSPSLCKNVVSRMLVKTLVYEDGEDIDEDDNRASWSLFRGNAFFTSFWNCAKFEVELAPIRL